VLPDLEVGLQILCLLCKFDDKQYKQCYYNNFLKEIDIEMRNKIVKIKRIFDKPECHYKIRSHLLD
jgi:hypothetical protein